MEDQRVPALNVWGFKAVQKASLPHRGSACVNWR